MNIFLELQYMKEGQKFLELCPNHSHPNHSHFQPDLSTILWPHENSGLYETQN